MTISIVTPVLDEERNLPSRARDLHAQDGPWQWIVADGGSTDASVAVATRLGARVVSASRGRGRQLRAGAALATGDVLLFLHADTSLPDGALRAIRDACARRTFAGGNFAFRFDDDTPGGRFLALVYEAKRTLLGVWYGDSAIFVRRDVYETLGGFEDIPLFEDIRFVERLRRAGPTIALRLVATSSSRRYRGRYWRTVAKWLALFCLYKCGVSPQRLARFYPPHREARAA